MDDKVVVIDDDRLDEPQPFGQMVFWFAIGLAVALTFRWWIGRLKGWW